MELSRVTSIAASGLRAEAERLSVSAHNVANTNTEDFEAQEVVALEQEGGGVRAEVKAPPAAVGPPPGPEPIIPFDTRSPSETVNQIQAQRAFEANAQVFRTAAEAQTFLIDIRK